MKKLFTQVVFFLAFSLLIFSAFIHTIYVICTYFQEETQTQEDQKRPDLRRFGYHDATRIL